MNRYLTLTVLSFLSLVPGLKSQGIIEFTENKGQWDNRVQYRGEVNNGAFFIRNGGFTVLQHNEADLDNISQSIHGTPAGGSRAGRQSNLVLRSHAWNVDFIGANPEMRIIADKSISTYNNYILGNDPSKWAGNCRIYQAITFQNVYPNVDVRYYTDNGTLKYDIIAKPGSDISKIAMRYIGIDKLEVKNKELVTSTSLGAMKESAPYTYQTKGAQRTAVNCKYAVNDNVVKFDVRNYDPDATVVIDPTLVFCSFSGSTADNWGYTATYGADGSMFGGGVVFQSQTGSFPTSPGAFQTVFQGGNADPPGPVDIGIIKLSPDGRNRIYATYIGGNQAEQPHSLIADAQGNLVITGRSSSPNYPVTAPNGQIGPGGGFDIIVTKLNAAGTALIGSKKIGGASNDGVNIDPSRSTGTNSLVRNYGDDGRSEVILDGAGNIYVASSTQSAGSGSPVTGAFPTTPGSFQTVFGGGVQDGVVLKLTPNVSAVTFSSFLGGRSNDAAYVLSLGAGGNIYVAGGTESDDFPGNKAGTIDATFNGSIDGYVAVIANNGSSIIRSTYLGTNGFDQVYGVQFDRLGFPYVMGQTTGVWTVLNAVYSNAGGKQFIAKLQPDLSAYVYSTAFGSGANTPNISPIAFLVDRCENVYVSGWGGHFGGSNDFNSAGTTGLPITPDAIKTTTDGKDMYFFVLQKNAAAQLFGSFFGENNPAGAGTDHVDGGTSRFDQNGVIYQAICGNCKLGAPALPYPTTPGAWSTVNNSPNCNLTMVKIAFNLAGVGAQVQSSINGVPRDTAGCVPLSVVFTDSIRNAVWYEWNFGDGTPTLGPLPAATGFTQTHTYTSVGTFQVMLIAIDSSTCNMRDTSYIRIRVGDLQAFVDFIPVKQNPCDSFKYRFDNLSIAPLVKPFGASSFAWDFGDGSPIDTTGIGSVFHLYSAAGTYNVILHMIDTSYCNYPLSDTFQLRVSAIVDAQFITPPTGCVPYNAVFNNTSVGGLTFQWNFGDGNTSNAINPTHTYTAAGTYNVVMIATDPNTCNITDTARFTITVFNNPLASFSYTPVVPVENSPNTFNNLSSPDAILFRWNFGDGDTLRTSSRGPVVHQYNSTGTFNACLRVFNVAGCFDDTCQQVQTIINPLVDVPNAFTPQTGDANSVVYVRGFGISKMKFIIWNRWGQKVFETASRSEGWNGKYKGALQPMDVYAYTLDVMFFDGTKTTKKGDITLIR